MSGDSIMIYKVERDDGWHIRIEYDGWSDEHGPFDGETAEARFLELIEDFKAGLPWSSVKTIYGPDAPDPPS